MSDFIRFDAIKDHANKELAQGFRTTFTLICEEIKRTYTSYLKITGEDGVKELPHALSKGAESKELKELSKELEKYGTFLTRIAKDLQEEAAAIPEDVTVDKIESWFEEVYKQEISVPMHVQKMLEEYDKRLMSELRNNVQGQLYRGENKGNVNQ